MKLGKTLIFPAGTGPGCRHAAACLSRMGIALTDHVSPEVTHLLLDIPTKDQSWRPLLRMLPPETVVIGGNLDDLPGNKLDLLRDEAYLAQNAAITADCALQVARPYMSTTFADTQVLVLGWGRIGKCLAKYLRALGAQVTVAARKESDRAMLTALAYSAVNLSQIPGLKPGLVFNTVPAEVPACAGEVKVDLASVKAIPGDDVIWARGLPAVHAPETTGRLIASRIFHFIEEDSL